MNAAILGLVTSLIVPQISFGACDKARWAWLDKEAAYQKNEAEKIQAKADSLFKDATNPKYSPAKQAASHREGEKLNFQARQVFEKAKNYSFEATNCLAELSAPTPVGQPPARRGGAP
jgi:hypothetical protein